MIHLIQWGLDMQAQFRLLTEEHHVDRCTVVLAWGPCSAASREPSRSQIEPVQCNGTLCSRGVHAGSALGHLICMHRLVPEGGQIRGREGGDEESQEET